MLLQLILTGKLFLNLLLDKFLFQYNNKNAFSNETFTVNVGYYTLCETI